MDSSKPVDAPRTIDLTSLGVTWLAERQRAGAQISLTALLKAAEAFANLTDDARAAAL